MILFCFKEEKEKDDMAEGEKNERTRKKNERTRKKNERTRKKKQQTTTTNPKQGRNPLKMLVEEQKKKKKETKQTKDQQQTRSNNRKKERNCPSIKNGLIQARDL